LTFKKILIRSIFDFKFFVFPLTIWHVKQKPSASSSRGFWCLIATHFQVAFSDNVLKTLVIFLVLGMNVSMVEKQKTSSFIGALFALPFILFSMYGGYFADRFSKRTVTIAIKIFELAVVTLVCIGLPGQNRRILLAGIFLMGTLAAFFGPSKYGLLPELLPERKLSWGNGVLEFGTYSAIILGTVAAAYMHDIFGPAQIWPGVILLALAAAGLVTSLAINRVPAADPRRKFRVNFIGDLLKQLMRVRRNRLLALAFAGNAYFNFIGWLLLLNLFFYGAYVLGVGDVGVSLFNVALALGIGLGSVAAGYASSGKIEHGLVPLGALGISIVSAILSAPGTGPDAAVVWLAIMGFAGGFFIVPVSAILQREPEPSLKGEVLAAANWLSFVGIYLASGAYEFLSTVLGLSPRGVFLVCSVLTFAGTIFSLIQSPYSLVRAVLWLATHTIYRVRVEGFENVPRQGGALLISNHVSFVDWLFLTAAADRPVRFLMGREYYDKPWIRPLARVPRVIPIPPEIRPHEVSKALRDCGRAIREGDAVCIFAEGGITRTGKLQPFRRGFEHLMRNIAAGRNAQSSKGNEAGGEAIIAPPIIPVALAGVWGSVFSFSGGRLLWKKPGRIPRVVTVRFGRPLPLEATADEMQAAVTELMK
jgi:acyl-[acyl-carrier-protein]-phospholipid O-acyltransferase/long-chain-fatty-acid--[acyl-carrier-protein] ligase